jgi:hypothetical protein
MDRIDKIYQPHIQNLYEYLIKRVQDDLQNICL